MSELGQTSSGNWIISLINDDPDAPNGLVIPVTLKYQGGNPVYMDVRTDVSTSAETEWYTAIGAEIDTSQITVSGFKKVGDETYVVTDIKWDDVSPVGGDKLVLTYDGGEISYTGGTASISISSSAGWTILSDMPWAIVSPGRGSGDGEVVVTFPANNDSGQRSVNIMGQTTDGSVVRAFTIYQGGNPTPGPVPVTNYELTVSATSYVVENKGEMQFRAYYITKVDYQETERKEVTSNPNASWKISSGNLYASVDSTGNVTNKNTSEDDEMATVEVEYGGTSASQSLMVKGTGPYDPGTDADYLMDITVGAYRSSGSYCPGLKGFYADCKLTTGTKEDLKINPASWGVSMKRLAQKTPTPVSFIVSDTIDYNCDFWICRQRYENVIETHNTGRASLNIHGYGFKNMLVNESDYTALYIIVTAATMGGKHISNTILLPPQPRAFINKGQSTPYICPQSGAVMEYRFSYANIDEESLGLTDLASEISGYRITSLGKRYSDGAGGTYYMGTLELTFTANKVGMSEGYEGSRYKYFTITGTSTLDTTQDLSCRCLITQEPYSYASFPYRDNVELDTYDPDTCHGLLVIPLDGLNIDVSGFDYRFCDYLSTKASPIYIDDNDTIETLVKEDGTVYNNEITFGEAIPISMDCGPVTINGNRINGYYLTIENQAWRIYDRHGGGLIELTFYDNAGNSWKDGLCIDKSWRDGSVSYITYRDYSYGWYC